MAQKGLIARAGKGLLDILMLLLRGIGTLCAAFGSALLYVIANTNTNPDESDSAYGFADGDRIVSNEEREAKNSGT